MSSTKRGGRIPHPEGDYATPLWCVKLAMLLLPVTPKIILDPCAGKGNIIRAGAAHLMALPAAFRMIAIELNAERAEQCAQIPGLESIQNTNALSPNTSWRTTDGYPPDLVLTNPPFVLAESFLRRALHEVAQPGGIVCMLLPVPFVSAKERRNFWKTAALEFNPLGPDMHVLTKRPSFRKIGASNSDSVEYAWFIFGPHTTGRWYRLEVGETPNPIVRL